MQDGQTPAPLSASGFLLARNARPAGRVGVTAPNQNRLHLKGATEPRPVGLAAGFPLTDRGGIDFASPKSMRGLPRMPGGAAKNDWGDG
jgi:hypothetical protein